jgi:alpha-D-ribose 1-methylphosphonate 5-triphosphate synthase subunit PhnG
MQPDSDPAQRRRWMAVLARAEAEAIAVGLDRIAGLPEWTVLRGPESGLVMVRGRAGGGGAAFNLGEMSVTRCTVRIATGEVGHAYIAGRDRRRAELAAAADALMQRADLRPTLEQEVIAPLAYAQAAQRQAVAAKAAATRVQFFTMRTMR